MGKTKVCNHCGLTKPVEDFYKNDSTCKEDRKERVRLNRLKNIDYYRDYDKKRFKNDPRVKDRHKRYQKTEAGKESARKSKEKWQERNPIKRAANIIVGNALRDKKLSKQPCEICGDINVHGHHDDYAYPLTVRWLCPSHHQQWHDENGEGLNGK